MKEKIISFFKFKNKQDSKNPVVMTTDFKGFFILLSRRFWNLSSVNLMFTLLNFPIFFLLYTFTGTLDKSVSAVLDPLFPAFYGVFTVSDDPFIKSLYPFFSKFGTMSVPSTLTYVFWGLSLLTLFTFGISNAGMTYTLRGYVRCEPVFIVHDYFSTIKRNVKQAVMLGIIDILVFALLIWDCIFWSAQAGLGFIYGIFFYVSLFLIIVYIFMRFYMYTIMITFDLSIKKIIKNSFIFAFLGFKRNVCALIGIVLVILVNYLLFGVLMPLGIMLPAIITIALCSFISEYCTYPVIKKYMIDPYYEVNNDKNQYDDEDVIFEDRG